MIRNNLARLLSERRMSIAELARRADLAYSVVHPIASGKAQRYDADTLDAICAALGCSVGDILEHVPD
ncbi:MAG: helix-turn-helix domain-containing protein [Chloroflexota bacterium]